MTIYTFLDFRMLYVAARSRSATSLKLLIWYGMLIVQIAVHVFAVVGVKDSGFIGVIWMTSLFIHDHNVQGFLALADVVLWGLSVVILVGLGIHMRFAFKRAGGLAAAKGQAFTAAATGATDFAMAHPDLVLQAAKAGANAAATGAIAAANAAAESNNAAVV